MERTSQSRHFNLHWVEHPADWLSSLEATAPVDPPARWKWLASHHQLLTLAKRSEREAGLSILWFEIQSQDRTSAPFSPALFGAVLPGERVALIPTSVTADFAEPLRVFLSSKIKFKRVMGTKSDLDGFDGFAKSTPVERQTAWGKSLSISSASPSDEKIIALRSECRRATEADRTKVQRWSRLFAIDTRTDPEATTLEAFEWLRRGRLLIFEDTTAIGMAALSGEYHCPRLGRIGRLSLVFIDPNHRGRGHGQTMLRSIEEEMRLEKMKGIVLYSDHRNERIRNLYSKLGFKIFDDWMEMEIT